MTFPAPRLSATRPVALDVSAFCDSRGCLGVVEGQTLPFDAKRLYFLYDLKAGVSRGGHAHKALQQVMLCMAGAVRVTFWDGTREEAFLLRDRRQGIFVPAGFWRDLEPLEDGTVVAVLASQPYDPDDYIYSKDQYIDWISTEAERFE